MLNNDVGRRLLNRESLLPLPMIEMDVDNWMWTGKVFQTMEAPAAKNERRPMVDRRHGGTSS